MKKKLSIIALLLTCALYVPIFAQNSDSDEPVLPGAEQRFYNYSGKSSLSFLSGGYTYDLADNKHLVEVGVLDFRYKWFGMSPINAEIGVGPDASRPDMTVSRWVTYKPSIQFYVPFCKCMALSAFGGCAVSMSGIRPYFDKNYTFNKEEDHFVDVFGGMSLYMTFVPAIPFEVRAEYRHPVVRNQGDVLSEGLYVSARIHFAKPFGRKK